MWMSGPPSSVQDVAQPLQCFPPLPQTPSTQGLTLDAFNPRSDPSLGLSSQFPMCGRFHLHINEALAAKSCVFFLKTTLVFVPWQLAPAVLSPLCW